MSTESRRLLIIGLDGGTFRILRDSPFARYMPHLNSLAGQGAAGELRSTTPPVTASAWTSFATGKQPGKHGVFGFLLPPSMSTEGAFRGRRRVSWPLANSTHIDGRSFWRMLGEKGKRVVVLEVPMYHPPEDVNGVMVSDKIRMGAKDATFPLDLEESLVQNGVLSPRALRKQGLLDGLSHSEEYIEHLSRHIALKEKLDIHIMKNYEWNCFVTVYLELDVFLHHFWKYVDPQHRQYDSRSASKLQHAMHLFFSRLDEAIHNLTTNAGDDVVVMLVSDHGFGPAERIFYVNTWLARSGFQERSKNLANKMRYPLWRWGLTSRSAVDIAAGLDFLNLRRKVPSRLRPLIRRNLDAGLSLDVDWSRTVAYFRSPSEQGIYLNLKGREPTGVVEPGQEYEGVRDDIMAGLGAMIDDETKQTVVKASRREQVYWGPHVVEAPDIVLELNGPYGLDATYSPCAMSDQSEIRSSGYHRREGILVAAGSNIRKGLWVSGAEIVDVAPTILYLMGHTVPADMDGKVLTDIFTEDFLARNKIEYEACGEERIAVQSGKQVYTGEELAKIREQLGQLGYL